MAALRRGIPGYANGTDNVPQMMPQTFQELPPELQQRLRPFQTPQTPPTSPTPDQAWETAHPIAQVARGVGSGLNPLAAPGTAGRDFTAAAQNPEASQATRAIADAFNTFADTRRLNVLGQAPTGIERIINMFGGDQRSDADLAQRDFTSNVYRNDDLTRQYLMTDPRALALAESDKHGFAQQVQDPGFRQIMQQSVANYNEAANHPKVASEDHQPVVDAMNNVGVNADTAHAALRPHQYTRDEFIAATEGLSLKKAQLLFGAQLGHIVSPEEKASTEYFDKLHGDWAKKDQDIQKMINDDAKAAAEGRPQLNSAKWFWGESNIERAQKEKEAITRNILEGLKVRGGVAARVPG